MAKVAFILADTFEDSEFQEPYDSVRGAGHEAVGLEGGVTVDRKEGHGGHDRHLDSRGIR